MGDKGNMENNRIVGVTALSEMMGLSKRRLQQLTEEKIIVRVGHNKYDVAQSIKGYVDFMIAYATPDENEMVNKDKEMALLTRTKRISAEVDLQTKLNELHRAVDIRDIVGVMLNNLRAQLLTLPAKIAPQVQAENEMEQLKYIIKNEITKLLSELTDYDPETFEAKTSALFQDDDTLEFLEVIQNADEK